MKKAFFIVTMFIMTLSTFCLFGSDEFKVNTYTDSDQLDSYIAMDGNGNFMITWVSSSPLGI